MIGLFVSKFVRLLQTFDEAEFKAFERWLQSPWCNTNKNLVRLLARLKPYYPGFLEQKLTREQLFRQAPGCQKCRAKRKWQSALNFRGKNFYLCKNFR